MKKLQRKPEYSERFKYPDDVKRIVEALADAGYEITPEQAEWAWSEYSDSMCAGWLRLPDEDEDEDDPIVSTVMRYFDSEEDYE